MKKRYVISVVLIIGLVISLAMIVIDIQKEDKNMNYDNYDPLGITSAKKPYNTHLWWEHSTYGLILVDSIDQTKLYISTDKGLNWSEIDLSDNTNPYKIQAGWLDGNDLWLVMCDNDGTADDFEVCYIELDDSNDCNPIGVSVGADANTVYAFDIFKIGTDHYVINKETRAGVLDLVGWDVDAAPFVEKGVWNEDEFFTDTKFWFGIVSGAHYYSFLSYTLNTGPILYVDFQSSGFTIPVVAGIGDYHAPDSESQFGVAYDGVDILYIVGEQNADGKDYLITYSITGSSHTIHSEYNVALMVDRNTATGVKEKAFHITEYKVYQLHPNLPYQLYYIALVESDAVLIAITDNFLMNDDGDMFEFTGLDIEITSLIIERGVGVIPTATAKVKEDLLLEDDMFLVFKDMFTTATASASSIIFEGYIEGYTERRAQVVNIKSPARELMILKPSGDYSGRTDEIIVDLIAKCRYVTVGTLSAGTAMGTITFGGDKSIFLIISEFALTDKFIFSFTPTGSLNYNNGTVDSGEDFTAASEIHGVHSKKEVKPINYVKIKGGYVDGVQVESDVYENEENWREFGKNSYEKTFSHLNTTALCNTTASNILSRWGSAIRKVQFNQIDDEVGLIQEGQTITLEYATGDPSIASDQFIIVSSVYEAKRGQATYMVSDAIV